MESLVKNPSVSQCVGEREWDRLGGNAKKGCRKEVGVSSLPQEVEYAGSGRVVGRGDPASSLLQDRDTVWWRMERTVRISFLNPSPVWPWVFLKVFLQISGWQKEMKMAGRQGWEAQQERAKVGLTGIWLLSYHDWVFSPGLILSMLIITPYKSY